MNKYRVGFEWKGLVLFLAVMMPNFIWFAIPSPNDILRVNSLTPVVDIIGSVCQIAFVMCLSLLIRKKQKIFRINSMIKGVIVLTLVYYICWVFYYYGVANIIVIMGLTLFPCAAFLLFAIDRKNTFAIVSIILFTICHLTHAIVNFIL